MMRRREYMSNLSTDKGKPHNDYNNEPVFYCKHCLSLDVRYVLDMKDSEYCDDCGSTDIAECSIEEWENLYRNKFGHNHLDKY